MLKIDRLLIDDAGANPIRLAEAIINQLPKLRGPVPVRQIAHAIDIYKIREENLDGLEGALLVPKSKSEGQILINARRHESRKRYTIAHEIGHYVNPLHIGDGLKGFICTTRDMSISKARSNDRHAIMEMQANQFAAELLMPSSLIKSLLQSSCGPDLADVVEISKTFNVSKEAAARRYIGHIHEPTAVIFSRNGVIRYIETKNNNFPKLSVWNNEPLPPGCLSLGSKSDIGEITLWNEVAGHFWLESSCGVAVFEQTLAQQNGYRMTLLTVKNDKTDAWRLPHC